MVAAKQALHLTAAALAVVLVSPAPAAVAGELWRSQPTKMDDTTELLRIFRECRRTLRNPSYSKETSAQLIEWLRHPNAAISCAAGRCLIKLGTPAYDDLLETVLASAPCPNALWVLCAISPASERLMPLLRSWMSLGSAEIKAASAASLSFALVQRKRAGLELDSADLTACLQVMERAAPESAWMSLQLRQFRSALESA